MRIILMVFTFTLFSTMAVASGDPVKGKNKIILCMGCHGTDGNSSTSTFPNLAGQGETYLVKQIEDFKSGARKEEHMTSMAETIDVADIADIAAYFSSQKRNKSKVAKSADGLGERIYITGIKSKGVDACASCHGDKGLGNAIAKYPLLAGQQGEYIEMTLKRFRNGERSNDPYNIMRDIAAKLTDEEISLLSTYIAWLD